LRFGQIIGPVVSVVLFSVIAVCCKLGDWMTLELMAVGDKKR